MYFTSSISNITPAYMSTAMSHSDSRDSTSSDYFTSAPMQVKYSISPSTYRSTGQATTSSTRAPRDSFSSGWLPSPYRSCMSHSSSSQGYDSSSSSSSYISDDDLLALDDLAMPPIEHIPSVTSAPQQPKREMTTEEHIAMLREMQDREQAQNQQQRQRAQQQRAVRFATEQKKPRRPSNLSQRRNTSQTMSRRT